MASMAMLVITRGLVLGWMAQPVTKFQRAGPTEQQVHLATFGHLDCSTIPELDANFTVEPCRTARVTAKEKMLFPFSHRNQPIKKKLCHSLHEDPV